MTMQHLATQSFRFTKSYVMVNPHQHSKKYMFSSVVLMRWWHCTDVMVIIDFEAIFVMEFQIMKKWLGFQNVRKCFKTKAFQ